MKKVYKNVFDFNATSMQSDGEEFRIGQISEELTARIENFRSQVNTIEQKASMPCLVTIIKSILSLVWICCLGGMLQGCAEGTSWNQMYKNAPVLFYVEIGAFVFWLFLFIFELSKKNKAYKEADHEGMNRQIKIIEEQIRMEMGIPEDAKFVDILCQCYEVKKGKKKLLLQPSTAIVYLRNMEMYVWRKDESLFFCDRTDLYKIPVECFGETELLKNPPVQVSTWNKEEPIDDKKFKEFKPYQTNAGIFVKQHYVIHVKGAEEEFVIRIPNYDFVSVQNLIREDK